VSSKDSAFLLARLFTHLDANHDGDLTKEEIKESKLGGFELEFDVLDADHDGRVSEKEWSRWWAIIKHRCKYDFDQLVQAYAVKMELDTKSDETEVEKKTIALLRKDFDDETLSKFTTTKQTEKMEFAYRNPDVYKKRQKDREDAIQKENEKTIEEEKGAFRSCCLVRDETHKTKADRGCCRVGA